jgi:hypothetical protein
MAHEAAVIPGELLGHATILPPTTISPDGQWLLLRAEMEDVAILVHVPTGASTAFTLPITAMVAGWR